MTKKDLINNYFEKINNLYKNFYNNIYDENNKYINIIIF